MDDSNNKYIHREKNYNHIPDNVKKDNNIILQQVPNERRIELVVEPYDSIGDVVQKLSICHDYGVEVSADIHGVQINNFETPTKPEMIDKYVNSMPSSLNTGAPSRVPTNNGVNGVSDNSVDSSNAQGSTNEQVNAGEQSEPIETSSTNSENVDSVSDDYNDANTDQSGDSSSEVNGEDEEQEELSGEKEENSDDENSDDEKSDEENNNSSEEQNPDSEKEQTDDSSPKENKSNNEQNTESDKDENGESDNKETKNKDSEEKENNQGNSSNNGGTNDNREKSNKYNNNKNSQNKNKDDQKNYRKNKKNNDLKQGSTAPKKEAAEQSKKELKKKVAKEKVKKEAKKKVEKEAKKKVIEKGLLALITKHPVVFAILVALLIIIILAVVLIILINFDGSDTFVGSQCGVDMTQTGGGASTGDIHVENADIKAYDKIKVRTNGKYSEYDVDDYVAGVLRAEVATFVNNEQIMKAFAISARSLAFYKMKHQGYVINSSANQNFDTNSSHRQGKYKKYAQETSGLILVEGKKGSYRFSDTTYDAVCLNSKKGGGETDSEYIMCQKQVHVPKSWLNKYMTDKKAHNLSRRASHGWGMSSWGAYYLVKEKGYTTADLINLFYDKNTAGNASLTLVSYLTNTSTLAGSNQSTDKANSNKAIVNRCVNNIADVDVKETPSSAQIIKGTSISQFLASKGTSIQAVNDGLLNAVRSAGAGTRAGVVTAATFTINTFLQYNARIPYMIGGNVIYGMNPSWGAPTYACSGHYGCYYYVGLDCGRFVHWTFLNGGIDLPVTGAKSYLSIPNTNKYPAYDTSQYIAQPGDVLVRDDGGHVVLVLKYYENGSDKGYLVAEASGREKGILVQKRKLSSLTKTSSRNAYTAVDLSSVYQNNKYKIGNFDSKFNSKRKDK